LCSDRSKWLLSAVSGLMGLDLYAAFMAASKVGVHKFSKILGCTSTFLCVLES